MTSDHINGFHVLHYYPCGSPFGIIATSFPLVKCSCTRYSYHPLRHLGLERSPLIRDNRRTVLEIKFVLVYRVEELIDTSENCHKLMNIFRNLGHLSVLENNNI